MHPQPQNVVITLDPPKRLIHRAHLRCGAWSWPRMRHLAEPARWKVQVVVVYLALQRAVAQAERGPSTFPWQETLQESLNNHQWSGLWFTAALDGNHPSLCVCSSSLLGVNVNTSLITSLVLMSMSTSPKWKLDRSGKSSPSTGIKTHVGFSSFVKEEFYVLQSKLPFAFV